MDARRPAADVDHDQPDNQRQRGDHLKIEQRLDPDPAKLSSVAHRGDAVDDRAEDDRRDDHLDQVDEAIAERFQALAEIRVW